MNFTLVQLRYFVAAAELGSMMAVTRELHISQSAVSSAITNLERELGVQLFIRKHAKGLTLTPTGARFLRNARNFLIQGNELIESISERDNELSGVLTIGCFQTLAPFCLPGTLNLFNKKYPHVEINLIEGELATLENALLDGSCEVALLYDIDLSSDITKEVLAEYDPYVILPVGHPLTELKKVSLPELAEQPMIMYDLPHSRDYFKALAQASGIEFSIKFRTTNFETVRALVARGHGYSILNQRPAGDRTYDGGRLIAKPISDKFNPLQLVIGRHKGIRPTRKASAFVAACRSFFALNSTRKGSCSTAAPGQDAP